MINSKNPYIPIFSKFLTTALLVSPFICKNSKINASMNRSRPTSHLNSRSTTTSHQVTRPSLNTSNSNPSALTHQTEKVYCLNSVIGLCPKDNTLWYMDNGSITWQRLDYLPILNSRDNPRYHLLSTKPPLSGIYSDFLSIKRPIGRTVENGKETLWTLLDDNIWHRVIVPSINQYKLP